MGVLSLNFRSLSLPSSSMTRTVKIGSTPSLPKSSLPTVTGNMPSEALAVGGFVAVAAGVPCEDAKLVEVEGLAVFRFGQDHQVLRDFFYFSVVLILDLVEREEGDDALAFRVLRDVEWDVEIDHASEDPANAGVRVANQPPVFHDWRRAGGLGRRSAGRFSGSASLDASSAPGLVFSYANAGGLGAGSGGAGTTTTASSFSFLAAGFSVGLRDGAAWAAAGRSCRRWPV